VVVGHRPLAGDGGSQAAQRRRKDAHTTYPKEQGRVYSAASRLMTPAHLALLSLRGVSSLSGESAGDGSQDIPHAVNR
jgi:hypothetical protein